MRGDAGTQRAGDARIGWITAAQGMHVGLRDERVAGRRLGDIGDWGGASRQLGARWEAVGATLLADHLAAERGPAAQLHLLTAAMHQEALAHTRLKNPDALLVVAVDGAHEVRGVDFKWSLEFAEWPQISAATLRALDEAANLAALLRLELRAPRYHNGFFVAPATAANRDFLRSPANRAQEYPLEAHEVLLLPVQPEDMFAPLPGWAHAQFLAALDRAERSLTSIEAAERYYRLGVGLAGALARLAAPLFADEPVGVAPLAALEALRVETRARSAADLVHHLGRRMEQREALERRLGQLLKLSYRFHDLAEDLARRGIKLSERPAEQRQRWLVVLRAVGDAHRRAVRQEGQALLAQGHSEAAALAALEGRAAVFEQRARARALRLIEKVLAGQEEPSEAL